MITARRRNSSNLARQLGLEAEQLVLTALKNNGLEARHATPDEDLHQGWDVEFNLADIIVRIDLTISRARLRQKNGSDRVRNGFVIVVLVDPRWSEEELFREVIRQVVYSLPEWAKRALLRELTT